VPGARIESRTTAFSPKAAPVEQYAAIHRRAQRAEEYDADRGYANRDGQLLSRVQDPEADPTS
jgi:hypothetical protein